MRKKISIGMTVVIVLLCCIATFQTTYIVLQNKFENKYINALLNSEGGNLSGDDSGSEESVLIKTSPFIAKLAKKLSEVDSIYRSHYIGELDDEVLIDSAIAGYVVGTGDQYAAYYNTESFKDFMSDIEGETAGIGVNVIYNTEYKVIEVLSVIPDSPALKAGVEPGDLIITIGEEKESVAALGYYPAINKLRGEVGTTAIFSVARGENYSETVDFRVVRDNVIAQSVMYHVYSPDNSVGVIKITGFDRQTPDQFVEAIDNLKKEGCDKFVMDLRYNPGGELISIVTILDYLLPKGPIVRIFDADGNEEKVYESDASCENINMVVLVNESTASAAELFTSAVRDYDKALIVGKTTYGKGCMQTTATLSDYSAVTVTYKMYSPPFSENYHGIGIVPDVEVELDESLEGKNIYKITDEEDNQLAVAVETFYK